MGKVNNMKELKISKTTVKFAESRLMGVDLYLDDDGIWILDISEMEYNKNLGIYDDASEPCVQYFLNENGEFSFYGNIYLPQQVKEDLPLIIKNEKELRAVIQFLHLFFKGNAKKDL